MNQAWKLTRVKIWLELNFTRVKKQNFTTIENLRTHKILKYQKIGNSVKGWNTTLLNNRLIIFVWKKSTLEINFKNSSEPWMTIHKLPFNFWPPSIMPLTGLFIDLVSAWRIITQTPTKNTRGGGGALLYFLRYWTHNHCKLDILACAHHPLGSNRLPV